MKETLKKSCFALGVPGVEFMYLVFTCMPSESDCRQLRPLFCLCDVFRVLINKGLCVDSVLFLAHGINDYM